MTMQYIAIDKAVIVQVRKELSQEVPMESVALTDDTALIDIALRTYIGVTQRSRELEDE